MSNGPALPRRFALPMLLALVPIVAGLFFVMTMQRANQSEVIISQDRSTIGVRHEVSHCGGPYHSVLYLWDAATGQQTAKWSIADGQWDFGLSSSGDQFLRRQSAPKAPTRLLVGRVADGPKSETQSFVLPRRGVQNGFHWADDDSRLLWEDYTGAMRSFNLRDGSDSVIAWERPAQARSFYWQSDDILIAYGSQLNRQEHVFQLVGDRLNLIGSVNVDFRNEYLSFFSDGRRVLVIKLGGGQKTCRVVELESGQTLTTLQADEDRFVSHWAVDNGNVICFYRDRKLGIDGLEKVVGAQVFDSESGHLKHETEFTVQPEAVWYDSRQERYFGMVSNFRFVSFDVNGRKREVAPDIFRWWWPARVALVTLAALWWLTWSLALRRRKRSYQPLVDILILQTVVFVCSGVRFWAYVYGPDWSGYLHVWESVLFLGSGLSIVTWFLVWVMLGPQRWPVRLGVFVFGVAAVLGTILLIWEAGSASRGFNASLAIAQTMTGTLSLLTVQLGLLGLARVLKVRMVHVNDTPTSQPVPVRRQATIRDLMVWLVSFGILFTIIKLREIAIPQYDNLAELVMIGSVGGTVAVLTLWLVMGSKLWRLAIIAIGYGLAWWYFDQIGRMEVLHVGLAWLPMIAAPAAVFRWNGYAFGKANSDRVAGEPDGTTDAVDHP